MSVYGMGSLFCGTEEQLDNFVNEGFVCIGWKKEDKPEMPMGAPGMGGMGGMM